MTSLLTNQKVNSNDIGYYINVGSLLGKVYQRTAESSGNTGALGGTFSTAQWVWSSLSDMTLVNWNAFSTTLATPGQAILKDMGRTIVSSTRTFRKIQLVRAGDKALSTFGVGGNLVTGEQYFTGYIEVGFGGEGSGSGTTTLPAPVAHYGR